MHRFVEQIARAMALSGGAVALALVGLICASVMGRELAALAHSDWLEAAQPGFALALQGSFIGPVPGDFELVEAGTAFAVFAFLPWCQMQGGHARVDIFARVLGARSNATLSLLWEALLAAFLLLIAWRLGAGMMGKLANGETTYLLQFPVWWAYAASFFAACIAAMVSLWLALRRGAMLLAGRGEAQ